MGNPAATFEVVPYRESTTSCTKEALVSDSIPRCHTQQTLGLSTLEQWNSAPSGFRHPQATWSLLSPARGAVAPSGPGVPLAVHASKLSARGITVGGGRGGLVPGVGELGPFASFPLQIGVGRLAYLFCSDWIYDGP